MRDNASICHLVCTFLIGIDQVQRWLVIAAFYLGSDERLVVDGNRDAPVGRRDIPQELCGKHLFHLFR